MAKVLRMTAREICDPVLVLVLMEPNNLRQRQQPPSCIENSWMCATRHNTCRQATSISQ